jgi:hypothetical protein
MIEANANIVGEVSENECVLSVVRPSSFFSFRPRERVPVPSFYSSRGAAGLHERVHRKLCDLQSRSSLKEWRRTCFLYLRIPCVGHGDGNSSFPPVAGMAAYLPWQWRQ